MQLMQRQGPTEVRELPLYGCSWPKPQSVLAYVQEFGRGHQAKRTLLLRAKSDLQMQDPRLQVVQIILCLQLNLDRTISMHKSLPGIGSCVRDTCTARVDTFMA